MHNILISKTDPYSFMGLMKKSRLGSRKISSLAGLMNAAVMSILLIFVISRMAQAAQFEDRKSHLMTFASNMEVAATCSPEACKMV